MGSQPSQGMRESFGCSPSLSPCPGAESPGQGRLLELGIPLGILEGVEVCPNPPSLPKNLPKNLPNIPSRTSRVFQQSREVLLPILLPQAPPRSFFWEKAAHHTQISKNKVDFGAPGIPGLFSLFLCLRLCLRGRSSEGKIPKCQYR